jgi:hypothetical protein
VLMFDSVINPATVMDDISERLLPSNSKPRQNALQKQLKLRSSPKSIQLAETVAL